VSNKSLKTLKPGAYINLERGLYAYRTGAGEIHFGISYVAEGKHVREMVVLSKTLARKVLAKRRAEIAEGRYDFPVARRRPTFSEFGREYIEHAKKNKRSWARDQHTVREASRLFGTKRLDTIGTLDVQKFKTLRAGDRAPGTVNRDLAVLKHMFNVAISWGHIAVNPVRDVKQIRQQEEPMRTLSREEEVRLVQAAAPHLRPIIVVALNTGMRRGELLGLQWDQVDLRNGAITVHHTKSGQIRHIPINALARHALEVYTERQGHVFRFKGNAVADLKHSFQNAVRRARIQRCRFHDLRHTFATRLVMGGVDLPTVKELLGHSSITTTMKYAHPTPSHRRAAVEVLVVDPTSRLLADGVSEAAVVNAEVVEENGAGARNRTADLRITNALLYQLSYTSSD